MSTPLIPELSTYRWSSADASTRFPVENPATGEVITTIQPGDSATAASAIAASRTAFESWRWTPPAERSALLHQCAAALEARQEELAHVLCLENGKPYPDALQFDVGFLVGAFRFFASLADKLPGQFHDRGSTYTAVVREPFGVCVGILPFNWPPIHAGGKLAPCLAAGNTMIVKPSEQAPLTVLRIVEILQGVLPADVVMAVPGRGPEVPQALVASPHVRAVSFTGSTAAGAAVARAAAATVTPLTLELGGKNAFIVFEDADVDRAVGYALEGGFFNKGEACTAASRVLVHESVHDRFVEKLAAGVRKLVTGNGMDSKTHVGPCVNRDAQQKVLQYIRRGEEGGATIIAQGEPPNDPSCKNGFFVQPTLFDNVTRHMTIAQEEIFGPVVTVSTFRTENEAVDIANESAYGLVGIVFSRDSERCLRMSRRLEVGMVWINNYFRSVLGTPFGGAKESGYGREHCIETLHEWTRAKAIHQPSGLSPVPHWRGVRDCLES